MSRSFFGIRMGPPSNFCGEVVSLISDEGRQREVDLKNERHLLLWKFRYHLDPALDDINWFEAWE